MPFTCPSGPRGMRADPAGNRRPFGGRSPGQGAEPGGGRKMRKGVRRGGKGDLERWEKGSREMCKGVYWEPSTPRTEHLPHPQMCGTHGRPHGGVAGSRGVSPPLGGPRHSEGSPQVSTGPYPSSSASPSAAAARAMRPASGRECKSRRRRHKAPGTLTHKSNTICTKTTCMNYKLHHKN